MEKHLIILPDGTEISSGVDTVNAIQAVTLSRCVNDAQELNPGSVCAGKLEVSFLCPGGGLRIAAGDTLRLFTEAEGVRTPVGVFLAEKPAHPTMDTMKLTAYDRVICLDKDLSRWLAGLENWPYTLSEFVRMVCQACGVTLTESVLPNGDYLIRPFAAEGITGRKLLQWAGQIAGRFCRATPEGGLEFAWYAPAPVEITPGGTPFYYENTLKYEDYTVAPVEKVQLHLTREDVGAVWPQEEGEKNTYTVTGNYLLTTDTTDALLPLARTLYAQLKDVTYTPCTLQIPHTPQLLPGHIVTITDRNGKQFSAYVMEKTTKDGRDTITCTGSHRRDSTSVVNSVDYKALSGKTLELKLLVEGLSVKASDLQKDLNRTDGSTQALRQDLAALTVQADTIRAAVEKTEAHTRELSGELSQTLTRVTTAEQTAGQLQLQVQTMQASGAHKVTTTTGFTFDEAGLLVDKSDSATKTTVTPDGMKVYKKSGGQREVLSATSDGVDAVNLHATTYLSVGGRSRFENYENDRTGCFWIGGT